MKNDTENSQINVPAKGFPVPMKTQAMEILREEVQQRHGILFVDFICTQYWPSFDILPNVAQKCGS